MKILSSIGSVISEMFENVDRQKTDEGWMPEIIGITVAHQCKCC